MEYTIHDLFDIRELDVLLNSFHRAFDVHCSIIDHEQNLIIGLGWTTLCEKFHRQNPATTSRCSASDDYVLKHLGDGGYTAYTCANGLVDVAFPIMIDGEHLGTFFFGQFFYEPPDLERFRAQAREFSFDEEAYISAVKDVRVYPKEDVDKLLDFYNKLVHMLARTGHEALVSKRTQAAVRISEKNHRYLLQNTTQGYWRINDENLTDDVNPALCRMLGYTRNEMLGRSPAEFADDKSRKIFRNLHSKIRTTKHRNFEVTLLHRTGASVEATFNATTIRDDAGHVQGIFALISDITSQSRHQRQLTELNSRLESIVKERTSELVKKALELENANVRLEKMSSLKTAFMGAVSKDLRAPLTALIGYIGQLRHNIEHHCKSCDQSDESRTSCAGMLENLNIVDSECRRLTQLVKDIIDLSNLESGQTSWRDEESNIDQLASEALRQIRPQLSKYPDLEITTDIEPGLPSLFVDPLRIVQVLVNLLDNACKYSLQGRIRLSVDRTDSHMVTFCVADSGQGIPSERLEHIFNLSHQLRQESSVFTPAHSTGLGLPLCKLIVEHYNGNIWAESLPGSGSAFFFSLPLQSDSEGEAEEEVPALSSPR